MSEEREKAFLGMIFQFLKEENYTETLHMLESETASFLNMQHIQKSVLGGNWEEVERYLSAFTKVGDNYYTTKIFFEIRKQKYLEALELDALGKAAVILNEELKVFALTWEDEFNELSHLLTERVFRKNKRLSSYTYAKIDRMILMAKLIPLFETNPLFLDKLSFPTFNDSRLRYILSQSTDWQKKMSRQNLPFPDMTLPSLTDDDCRIKLRRNCVGPSLEQGSSSVSPRLTECRNPSQCLSLILPGSDVLDKISALVYAKSGIILLSGNGVHLFWRWPATSSNPLGMTTTENAPNLWQPELRGAMVNDLIDAILLERTSCFALSEYSDTLVSSSGGAISLYDIMSFQKVVDFLDPPPMATALAFHPLDSRKIVIGMDDATVWIYDLRFKKVQLKMEGHFARITGLAVSHRLGLLVSAGADSQIIVRQCGFWLDPRRIFMKIGAERGLRDTKVQFHQDQRHFLAYNETQLSIYDAVHLTHVNQWVAEAPISQAVFSCDGQLIYACFHDCFINIFSSASFTILCRIYPYAYIPHSIRLDNVNPTAMAANLKNANQFAIGLSNGMVIILEPLRVQQ